MNRNKICPECETEYLPHIEKCADCGAALILYDEYRGIKDERRRMAEKTLRDGVVVRKGDLKWLDELYNVLIDAGIPCTVTSETACKGHCGDDWLLVVSKADQERAKERIEHYFMEMHPELRVSNELANEGKCPACGFPMAAGANVCPDCGLTFEVIDEEEDEE